MKYINNKIIAFTLIAALAVSCVDEYDYRLQVEKPQDVAVSEYLNQFDLLKSYVNRSGTPFRLAAGMPASEFVKRDIAFSTLLTNFDAVDLNGSYDPLNTLKVDGNYDFNGMQTAANIAAEVRVILYGGTLCSDQGQRTAYYNKLIEPIDIPVQTETGTTKLFNFDNDVIGKIYPMTGNSSATVEKDPAGESGHVLHVGTNEVKAADSYAKLHVKLPDGRVLGDYVKLNIDLRHVGNDGIWGNGMQVLINGTKFGLGINADGLGAGGDKWKRGIVIKLNDAAAPGFVIPENLKALSEFDLSVGANSVGAQYYLDNISMDYEVSGKGSTTLNFEDDKLGATYPMTNGGKNEVVNDPDGESGKVLQIVHANQSFPKFHVKLKEGMTLGDYTGVTMDMRLNAGQYGSGLRVVINGTTFEFGRNAADYGFSGGQNTWKRGGIYVKFVKEGTYTALGEKVPAGSIEIPNTMKDLTEIDEFSLGSASGDWDAYIDNLKFSWEVKPQHIEKTPEEKAEIFTKEMRKWIGGMVYAGVNELNSVKIWNIISNPLDKTENANTFKWSEYLGDEGYARTAVRIARDTVKNVGVELELFVSQTLNQYDEMGNSADKLIALVNTWEGDDVTKIDGYNILLSAIYSKDANFQKGNEAMITELFEKLSKTDKLVRVSNLSMMVEDTNGNYIATNKMSEEDKTAAVSYMAFIMQQYRKLISKDKQYGISIANMTETSTGYTLSPWTSNYNRSVMYEGIIKGLISK